MLKTHSVLPAIHLEQRYVAISVYLISRRVPRFAFQLFRYEREYISSQKVNTNPMSVIAKLALHVFEAELAYPESPFRGGIFFRVRRIVPRLDVIVSDVHSSYS